jgi:uncharacterized protein (TIGR02594 family)
VAARDVQFIIRARDEASSAFENISSALQEISGWNGKAGASSNILASDLGRLVQALGSVDRVAQLVNGASARAGTAYEQQSAKVKSLEADLANLKAQAESANNAMSSVKAAGAATGNTAETEAQVTAIAAAQKQLNSQIDLTSNKLGRARGDLEALGTEYQRAASLANAFDAAQPGLKQGQQAAAAATALQEQSQWLERIRAQMAPAAAIQQHYREEIEKANAARAAGLYKTEQEYQMVLKLLETEQKRALAEQGVGPTGRPTLLGMTPWQSTNLMYQVNDVVSGLAMGQKPSQIIAQQLGQIVQLFPKLGSGIMAAFGNPYFLGAAAIVGTVAFAIKQAADQADRLRSLSAILKATADGANYSAAALNENVKALENYHLTADEATTITKTFVKDGLNPAYFVQFGQAAKDMSRVLGTDVKDAATQVADAFTGGYDAVAKLDDATNFLTAAERQHIRAMFDSGNAAAARKLAFDKFAKSQHDAAEEMRGPWARAIDHIDTAWEHAKQGLADSGWANALRKGIEGVAGLIDDIADAIDRVNEADRQYQLQQSHGTVTVQLPAASAATPEQEARAKAAANAGNGDTKAQTQVDQKAINDARTQIAQQRELTSAVTDLQKARVAGEQAYRDEIEKTGNKAAAELKRQAAAEQVITQIQMQRRQGLLSAAQGFLGKRENNREDVAVLESLFNQYGIKTPQGGTVDPGKLAWCAAFVNAMLASKGLPTTGSLAASSFKNYGTKVSLEEAQPGDIVVLNGHVGFFAGYGPNGTVRILGGNQGKTGQGAVSVANFKRSAVQSVRRVGSISEGYDGQDSELQYAEQIATAQDSFNKKLEVEAAQRKLVIDYMRKQLGMSSEQLLASQRQEAIDQAITQAKQEAVDKHIQFDDSKNADGSFKGAQAKQIADQVGATFDLEHAEEAVNAALQEQQALRQALLNNIQAAYARGDDKAVAELTAQLNAMSPALDTAIDKLEAYWEAAPGGPKKDAALQSIRQLREEIKGTAGDLDKLHLDEIGRRIDGAQQLQQALQTHIDDSQLLGNGAEASTAQSQLQQVNDQLLQLRDTAIEAWKAVLANPDEMARLGLTPEGIQATIAALQDANHETQLMGRQFLATGKQINQQFAQDAIQGVDSFFQKVGQGQNVFSALGQSFLQFAIQFLQYIAEMIIEQAIFNAISGGSGMGGGGGIGGLITGLFHGGGIAGSPTMHRAVSPAVFAGAVRYHTGGLVGLKPDEVPAILKRGEEVLTQGDVRHRNNMGGRETPGGGNRGIRQILAIGDDEIANAMAGAAGEEIVLTHIRRNRSTVKTDLG